MATVAGLVVPHPFIVTRCGGLGDAPGPWALQVYRPCSILSLDRVLDFDSPTLTSYFTLSVRGQVVVLVYPTSGVSFFLRGGWDGQLEPNRLRHTLLTCLS